QAEDGIRDLIVTGVQTCALPISWPDFDKRATITTIPTSESFLDGIMLFESSSRKVKGKSFFVARTIATGIGGPLVSRANTNSVRSEERRVGKEWRSRWSPYH